MPLVNQLSHLESAGLIRILAVPPELEVSFRHVLVQDAAWVADPGYSLGLFFGTGSNSVANWVNYDNKEANVLLEQTLNTADAAKRRELGQKAHRIIVDDAPWGFYIGTGFYLTARDNIAGLNWRPNNLINYAELSFKA